MKTQYSQYPSMPFHDRLPNPIKQGGLGRDWLWAEGCFCIKADRCGWLKATPPLPTGSCAVLAALHRKVFSGAFKYLL